MSGEQALELGQDLEEFTFVKLLGAGGFGITYQAIDRSLQRDVAIKEYFPQQFAERLGDSTIVSRPGDDNLQTFQWGLDRFLTEARTLAKIDHPNVVKVSRYFEHNGTAYLVMAYEEGSELADWLTARSTVPSEDEVKQMILPLLDGLLAIHAQGLIHRDIKPQNIVVRANGSPVLIDFGSARAVGQEQTSLTTLISPGYSPPEQYSNDPAAQGPWTDIYAMAGVIYRMISGQAPPDAMSRIGGAQLQPAATVAKAEYSASLLQAVDQGLQMEANRRPQNIEVFRALMLGEKPPTSTPLDSEATTLLNPAPQQTAKAKLGKTGWISAAVVAGLAALVGVYFFNASEPSDTRPAPVVATPPTEEPAETPLETSAGPTVVEDNPGANEPAPTYALSFRLSPPEARVEVNGRANTPGDRFVQGDYLVSAQLEGYVRTTQEVTLNSDRVIDLNLAKNTFPFTISTRPVNATVRVANLEQAYTPGMALAPGTFAVEVSAPGYRSWTGNVVHGGRATTQAVNLAKLHALTLNLAPADADVQVAGRAYSPGMQLVGGEYELTVRREGFQSYEDSIRLDQDRVIDVNLTALGVLTFILTPADAQIELPDIGQSYRPGMRLPVGPLRVVASKPGYQSDDREVLIRGGNNAIVISLRR
jgi:serine/threonine protein kinase